MRRIPFLFSLTAICLAGALRVPSAAGQASPIPTISDRQFTGGSAKMKVTGSGQIDAEVPINTQASVSNGGDVWIQYGASGGPTPEATITVHDGEIGFSLGKGKFVVTASIQEGGEAQCTGKTDVTATLVSGHYTCPGIVSYDSGTHTMGKVTIEISFTAKT